MVTTELKIHMPNDFQDGVHVARCKQDLSNLIELCQHYLDHEEERVRLAKAAREHLLKHHTGESRAQRLLKISSEFISTGQLPALGQ
jgi:spore maturation protein CgeB